jgi:hypothetical protein
MSVRGRTIRLIALAAARYGNGSGSDQVHWRPVATAPVTVTERSFPYIQLKYALERIYLCLWPRSVVCE